MNRTLLIEYANDCDNPKLNFGLGKWYEGKGYISPAASFYLRCAELTDDVDLRYEALIKVFVCYDRAGSRDLTSETTLKQAIALCPHRVEAYFLLAKFHEYRQNFIESYTNASIAISLLPQKTVMDDIEYDGDHCLYFLKAHSAWHIGKPDVSRDLYKWIMDNLVDGLGRDYKALLQTNLSALGSGDPSKAIRKYDKQKCKLKNTFEHMEEVERNFSQAYQDICTLTLLNGKKNGTYLEIGAADPFHGNNTALLEQFGWNGVGLEYNPKDVNAYKAQRNNLVLCEDALKADYDYILNMLSPDSKVIDYLQLDIEPASNTFMALALLPLHEYSFRFITYEHDHYCDVSKSYRYKSRLFLESLGYELLINDISPFGNYTFEDWWYHPGLVDKDRVDMIKNVDLSKVHDVEDIFLAYKGVSP